MNSSIRRAVTVTVESVLIAVGTPGLGCGGQQATSGQIFSATPASISMEQAEKIALDAPRSSRMPEGFGRAYLQYLRSQPHSREPLQPRLHTQESISARSQRASALTLQTPYRYLYPTDSAYIYPPNRVSLLKLNNRGKMLAWAADDSGGHPALLSWLGASPTIMPLTPDIGYSTFVAAGLDDNGIVVGFQAGPLVNGTGYYLPAWLDSTELSPVVHVAGSGAVAGEYIAVSPSAGYAAGFGSPYPPSGAGCQPPSKGFILLGRYDSPNTLQPPFGNSLSCHYGGQSRCSGVPPVCTTICPPRDYDAGLMTNLSAVNDSGEAVGVSEMAKGTWPQSFLCEEVTSRGIYLRSSGSVSDITDAVTNIVPLPWAENRFGPLVSPSDINNSGLIVGTAFLWKPYGGFLGEGRGFKINTRTGSVAMLAPPPAPYAKWAAYAVNGNGYALGYISSESQYYLSSAVWAPGGEIFDLGVPLLQGVMNDSQVIGVALEWDSYLGGIVYRLVKWDLPQSLTVKLEVTPKQVEPVRYHCFDAVQQNQASLGCRTLKVDLTPRADIVQVRVLATSGDGSPIQGASVRLAAKAKISGDDGHQHGDVESRPVGTFFPAGADPNTSLEGTRGQITGRTASDGTASFQYLTSGVSGQEDLTGTVVLGSGASGESSAQVNIKVQNVVEISRVGTDYSVGGQTATHPRNNFGTAGLRDAATACFSNYKTALDQKKTLPYFIGGGEPVCYYRNRFAVGRNV